MTLQLNETIEGLSTWDDHEIGFENDNITNAMMVHFDVVAEEMPFLTEQEGRLVHKNFVWIFKEKHLGNFQMGRRLRDSVTWDEANQKWVITKLHKSQSDIRQYPNEWNAFYRSLKDGGEVGIPLSILFKQDPSKTANYARFKINTVERLAALPAMDLEQLGPSAKMDAEKAKAYLAKVKEQAPMVQVQAKLDEKDAQIAALLKSQAALEAKLTELLEAELERKQPAKKVKAKSGKKAKAEVEPEVSVEGIERIE